MSNTNLPKNWLFTTLGKVVDYGKTVQVEPEQIDPSTWVLELEDLEKDTSRLLNRKTFAERNSKSSKNLFEKGDILYGKLRPYLNKVIIADQPGCCTTEIIPIKVPKTLNNRYLFYWLKSPTFLHYVAGQSHGLNMPRLGTAAAKAAPFVLAPISVQSMVADRLDHLLARVDNCRAHLDRAAAAIKRFRQSALMLITQHTVSANTKLIAIKDICIEAFDGPFGSKLKTEDYTDNGVRVARLENIGHLAFLSDKKTYISETKFSELKKNRLRTDDILFSSFVDQEIRVCVLPKMDEIFINKADCFCLRIDPQLANHSYIAYSLASHDTYLRIKNEVHGATRPRINLSFLKQFQLPLPSLEEQNQIVEKLTTIFVTADNFEAKVATARERVDNLTASILAKAFRGELL